MKKRKRKREIVPYSEIKKERIREREEQNFLSFDLVCYSIISYSSISFPFPVVAL